LLATFARTGLDQGEIKFDGRDGIPGECRQVREVLELAFALVRDRSPVCSVRCPDPD